MALDKKDILKRVSYIEIKTRRLVDEVLSGAYESVFKGRGIEFHQVRDYVYGDDFRTIDWNTSARTGRLHVKEFVEERELTVILAVDISGSQFFGVELKRKIDMTVEICAALGLSAMKNNDRVGLLLFDDTIRKYIPPKKGKKNILRIIMELINIDYLPRKTDISLALEYLNNIHKRKAIVFMFSDFFNKGFEKDIILTSKKHDFIALSIYDAFEIEPKRSSLITFMDMETGRVNLIDLGSKREILKMKALINEHIEEVSGFFQRNGIDHISIKTDESYEKSLINFFRRREKRLRDIG